MKKIQFVIPLILTLIAACAPTPTSTPVPPTSTLAIPTSTATLMLPTATSTHTATPTSVPTSTPRATETPTATSTFLASSSNLDYDNNRDVVVIYADLQPYPVPPPGKPCLFRYYPRLRIWGDGLVFFDDSEYAISGAIQRAQWNGHLDPEQVRSVLKLMDDQGFFGKWDTGMPIPNARRLRLGVNLKSKGVEYTGTDLLYTNIVRQIMPHLTTLSEPPSDERIKKLLTDSKPCTDGQ